MTVRRLPSRLLAALVIVSMTIAACSPTRPTSSSAPSALDTPSLSTNDARSPAQDTSAQGGKASGEAAVPSERLAASITGTTAITVKTCGGVSSPGNIYPCCTYAGSKTAGNCTFYAWERARQAWGVSLPGWGNARTWASNASNDSRFLVLSSPLVNTIAVNTTAVGGLGHVAWVLEVLADGRVKVAEQLCGSYSGVRVKDYPASYFNAGFIWMVPQTLSPPPSIIGMWPQWPVARSGDQQVRLNGQNFRSGLTVNVTWPTGRATLSGAQIRSVWNDGVELLVTLGSKGTWTFQVRNPDGLVSNAYSIRVN